MDMFLVCSLALNALLVALLRAAVSAFHRSEATMRELREGLIAQIPIPIRNHFSPHRDPGLPYRELPEPEEELSTYALRRLQQVEDRMVELEQKLQPLWPVPQLQDEPVFSPGVFVASKNEGQNVRKHIEDKMCAAAGLGPKPRLQEGDPFRIIVE